VALSLGNLCFISAWFSALYDSDHGYFNKSRVTAPTLLALAANILWVAGVAWLVMRARRRSRSRIFHLLCESLFLMLLLLPLDFCRHQIFHVADYQLVAFLKRP
jgi:threonine/homoserine/homoserine lactone efflux protein